MRPLSILALLSILLLAGCGGGGSSSSFDPFGGSFIGSFNRSEAMVLLHIDTDAGSRYLSATLIDEDKTYYGGGAISISEGQFTITAHESNDYDDQILIEGSLVETGVQREIQGSVSQNNTPVSFVAGKICDEDISPFQGHYEGTITGNRTGSLAVTVKPNGELQGTVHFTGSPEIRVGGAVNHSGTAFFEQEGYGGVDSSYVAQFIYRPSGSVVNRGYYRVAPGAEFTLQQERK